MAKILARDWKVSAAGRCADESERSQHTTLEGRGSRRRIGQSRKLCSLVPIFSQWHISLAGGAVSANMEGHARFDGEVPVLMHVRSSCMILHSRFRGHP